MDQQKLLEPVDGLIRVFVDDVGSAHIAMKSQPLLEAARHVLLTQDRQGIVADDLELVDYWPDYVPKRARFRRKA